MGLTMNERFSNVWDALPPYLRDSMPLQTEVEIEAALFDATEALASKKGFTLARTVNGYRLTGHGRTIHTGQLEDAAKVMRKADKSPVAALAGAGGATALGSPENASQADFVATPIATSN